MIGDELAKDLDALIAEAKAKSVTAPTPERRVGEAVELHLSGVRYAQTVHGDWLNAVYPELPVHPTTREALDKIARLTAEVERLRGVATAALAVKESGLRLPVALLDTPAKAEAWLSFGKALAALSLPTPAPEATE